MFDVENDIIYVTRGDDVTLPVNLKIRGEEYQLRDGDTLTLTVVKFQKDNKEGTVVFSTTSSTNEIIIGHSDTEELTFGKYDADIQLNTAEGKIYTVFPRKKSLSVDQLIGKRAWDNFWIVREVTKP